jgi:hypothetical protein
MRAIALAIFIGFIAVKGALLKSAGYEPDNKEKTVGQIIILTALAAFIVCLVAGW